MPVGVGIVLGVILGWLALWCRVSCRTRLVSGTVALALVTVLTEHAWLYHDFRRQWQESRARSAEVAMFRPEKPWSPTEYFSREATAGRTALWAVDATLIVVAAVVSAATTTRRLSKSSAASDAAVSSIPTPDT
jgi:hypothetical protein